MDGIYILAFISGVGGICWLALWLERRWDFVKDQRKTVCVDFDGVIHSYTTPWQKPWIIPDPPVPGAIDFLLDLLCANYRVVICSARCNSWRGRRAVDAWLRKHSGNLYDTMGPSICEIEVTSRKPGAIVYIDDRALRFDGRWPGVESLANMRPWNRPDLSGEAA